MWVERFLRELGADQIDVQPGKVTSTCPLAPWTHRSGTDSHPSFAVLETRYGTWSYRCFGCGCHGGILNLLWSYAMRRGQMPRLAMLLAYDPYGERERTAVAETEYRVGGKMVGPAERRVVNERAFDPSSGRGYQAPLLEERMKAPQWLEEAMVRYQSAPVPAYASNRGISVEMYGRWGLGNDVRSYRLVFPIYTRDGDLLATTSRLYVEDGDLCVSCGASRYREDGVKHYRCPCGFRYAKWVHSKGFPRRHVLFGAHLYEPNSPVVLVEGPMDAMRLYSYGVRSTMATLGSRVSVEQVQLVARMTDQIFVLGDSDPAGQQMNDEVVEIGESLGVNISKIVLESGDPGDLSADEAKSLIPSRLWR